MKTSLKHSEQSINNIIMLKQAAKSVLPVFESLNLAKSELLVTIREVGDTPDKVPRV